MSDQKKKHEEWNERETEGKSEPFSIFSHTMEYFAYPSALSPGAANIFITRFICCGVRGINGSKTKKKANLTAVVCFRSFIV